MVNPKICDCPFTEWCHEVRQELQKYFREKDTNYKVSDCDFNKWIKEKQDQEKPNRKRSKGGDST